MKNLYGVTPTSIISGVIWGSYPSILGDDIFRTLGRIESNQPYYTTLVLLQDGILPDGETVVDVSKEVEQGRGVERKVVDEDQEETRDQFHQLRGAQDTGYRGRGQEHYQQRYFLDKETVDVIFGSLNLVEILLFSNSLLSAFRNKKVNCQNCS